MQSVSATAPGKLILCGEHVVIYGQGALVIPIARFSKVEIFKRRNSISSIQISLPEVGFRDKFELKELFELLDRAQQTFSKFKETQLITDLEPNHRDPSQLALYAVALSLQANRANLTSTSLEIIIESNIPTGIGLGSSSALVTALLTAMVRAFSEATNSKLDQAQLIADTIAAEELYHGRVSGLDQTIAATGRALKFSKPDVGLDSEKGSGKIVTENLIVNPKANWKLLVINSGYPNETTGEMVAKVAEFREANPEVAFKIFAKLATTTEKMTKSLASADYEVFYQALAAAGGELELLGVMDDSGKYLRKKLAEFGLASKVSGAGGVTGGSGVVIATGAEANLVRAQSWLEENSYEFFETGLYL